MRVRLVCCCCCWLLPTGVRDLLASRTFQAAIKLLLSAASVLLTTMLLMVYIPAVGSSVPIFGYAAVVLCFQPRVEATVDQVGMPACTVRLDWKVWAVSYMHRVS